MKTKTNTFFPPLAPDSRYFRATSGQRLIWKRVPRELVDGLGASKVEITDKGTWSMIVQMFWCTLRSLSRNYTKFWVRVMLLHFLSVRLLWSRGNTLFWARENAIWQLQPGKRVMVLTMEIIKKLSVQHLSFELSPGVRLRESDSRWRAMSLSQMFSLLKRERNSQFLCSLIVAIEMIGIRFN